MKLKYLFLSIFASVLCLVGCQEEALTLDNIKLSDTFLTIDAKKGGDVVLTVSATEDWFFVQDENWPEVVKFVKDAKAKHDKWGNLTNDAADIDSKTASWLSADIVKGSKGETKVTFHADATEVGREIELKIIAGERNRQFVKIRQGEMTADYASCAEINSTGIDGKAYKVKKVTVDAIENTEYGNMWVTDGTDRLYIYGTLDKDGKPKNFGSLKIEVGDELQEIEGARGEYKGTPQLVNITVGKVVKSLLKVVTEPYHAKKEGETFEVRAEYKGSGTLFEIDPSCADWVKVAGIKYEEGVADKYNPNPADIAIYSIEVAANEGADRVGKITFASGSSSVVYEFTQEGAILDINIPDFKALESGSSALYRLTGVITKIAKLDDNYNNAEVTIEDVAGNSILLYRIKPADPDNTKISELNLTVGDKLTAVGKKGDYNGNPQMVEGYVEVHEHYENVSLADFLAAGVSDKVLYRISGTVTNVKEVSASYKNATFTISDSEGNDVLIYRMKSNEIPVEELGIAVGKIVTVTGQRGEYNGNPQMVSPFFQSIAEGEGGDEPGEGGEEPGESIAVEISLTEPTVSADGITVATGKANGTSAPAVYSGALRLYAKKHYHCNRC